MKSIYLLMFTILILPLTSPAYEILLDLDDDNDPNTIRENTGASSAVVRIILQPTEPSEWITDIVFGLGGTCWPCDYIFPGWAIYGTELDLSWDNLTLPEFPLLTGNGPTCTLSIICMGNPGFSCWWNAWAEGFHLNDPVFIASFNAWVADPAHPGCPNPPADLMAFAGWSTSPGNSILLADPELAAPDLATAGLKLQQNRPNPFNPSTNIAFELACTAIVTVTIHDASGRTIYRSDLGWLALGHHEVTWRGADESGRAMPSGVYFYRVSAGELNRTRRMVLLR